MAGSGFENITFALGNLFDPGGQAPDDVIDQVARRAVSRQDGSGLLRDESVLIHVGKGLGGDVAKMAENLDRLCSLRQRRPPWIRRNGERRRTIMVCNQRKDQ